jgi:hypothetical protein
MFITNRGSCGVIIFCHHNWYFWFIDILGRENVRMIPIKSTNHPPTIEASAELLLLRLLIRQFDQLMKILLAQPIPLIEIIPIQFFDRPRGHRLVISFHGIYQSTLVYEIFPFVRIDLSSTSFQIRFAVVKIILGQQFINLIFPGRP